MNPLCIRNLWVIAHHKTCLFEESFFILVTTALSLLRYGKESSSHKQGYLIGVPRDW